VVGQVVLLLAVALLGAPGIGDLPPVDAPRVALVAIGVALLLGGLTLGLAGARALGAGLTATPRPKAGAALVDSGVYGVIRHPLYAALILASLGWGIAMARVPALAAAIALAAWLDAKARREERWLVEAHPGYEAYRRRTHRFVPGVY
jgi:protein-S-isoprenylcysteine O-methyltransferase Ste14